MERRSFDLAIILPLVGISIFGFLNMVGIRRDLLQNYVLFLILGWIVYYFASRVRMNLLEQNYKPLYAIFVVLLFVTYFLTDPIRGSRRWIDLPFFRFQTSEFFKPFFIIAIASVLSSANRFTPRKFTIVMVLSLIPGLLIYLQPDLGTAIIYAATFISMLYFSGLSTRLAFQLACIALLSMPLLWHVLKDYQKNRIIGFLNPDADPQGITYNLHQAIITIGSGMFLGRGLGLGTQARYRFLPEFQTDFAFASLVEQFGFLGGALLIALYAVILARILVKLFRYPPLSFQYMFLVGAFFLLFAEVAINIGMNMGLMPVTGVALPFISYGGSSILSTMIVLGFVSAL